MSNFKHFMVRVDGNVVAIDRLHYAQSWSCTKCSTPDGPDSSQPMETNFYNPKERAICGNLNLNRHVTSIPYAHYYVPNGSISATDSNSTNLSCAPGAIAACCYYKDYMQEVKSLLQEDIPKSAQRFYYRGLYMEVFSLLELFLSDYILCLIYSEQETYDNAVRFYIKHMKKQKITHEDKLDDRMHKYYSEQFIYHRFDKVKKLYDEVAGIDFPDTTLLGKALHKRNNIVHRFSISNIDRMSMPEVSLDDVKSLISNVDTLVNELEKRLDNRSIRIRP